MKKIALLLAIIFAVGIIAPAFAEDTSSNVRSATGKQVQELREKYQNTQAQYMAAKQQYLAAKENYTSSKKDWESARKTYIEKRNSTNATVDLIAKGKLHLIKTLDNRIKHLELVKSKIENMSVLTDAEKNSSISELNANIAALEAFRPQINAITTKQGLKDVAEKIKVVWTSGDRGVARAAGLMLSAREEHLIALAKNVSADLKKRIDALNASGKNTAEYAEILSEFNAKIASAQQDIESARAKFNAAGNASASDEKALIKEGNELLKSANEKIKEAHKLIKEAVKNAASKIKEARKEKKEDREGKKNKTDESNTPPALP